MSKSLKRLEFITHFYKESKTPIFFERISYFGWQWQCSPAKSENNPLRPNAIYSIRLIPEYFSIKLRKESYNVSKIKQFNWGYSILLKDFKTSDGYLEKQFNSNFRKVIRRNIRRLESCFNIQYKMYHGEISREKYESLISALHKMLVVRFNQRGESNKELLHWNQLWNITYDQILNRRASLFVIYHEDHPIEISLNYHFDKILFSSISSYDINYSKFGLGHVEIYKQVEWCLKNDYILFDMGVGGMDYKRRWSNNIYRFGHHIVYGNHSTVISGLVKLEILKVQLKEYLKSKKVNLLFEKITSLLRKLTGKYHFDTEKLPYNSYKIETFTEYEKLEQVDIGTEEFSFLKKIVYDFLYSNTEHIEDVHVFRVSKEARSFLICGKKNKLKLVFEP